MHPSIQSTHGHAGVDPRAFCATTLWTVLIQTTELDRKLFRPSKASDKTKRGSGRY